MNNGKITLSQLEQYLSKAAWILKGPVDAADFKVYIFPLLFFKRISDVYDEEYSQALDESGGDVEYATLPEFHRFLIPEGCHWNDVRAVTTNVGQELNLMTSAIARMNMFLHGIEDFKISRGDTLKHPAFLEKDKLKKFNIILANPPYSIKQWYRTDFEKDPYGRNIYGTPPQGCADYAFQQHIIKSLDDKNGRCAILWPHGILFRDAEAHMRKKMIESDVVEAVIGLGPNLFYNSPMEACILVCNKGKKKERQGKILFINAVNDVKRESAFSYLTDEHIVKIHKAFVGYKDIRDFAKIVDMNTINGNRYSLNLPLYLKLERSDRIQNGEGISEMTLDQALKKWQVDSNKLKSSILSLIDDLNSISGAVKNGFTNK